MRLLLMALLVCGCLVESAVADDQSPGLRDRVPAQSLVEELKSGLGVSPPADARPINKITLELIKDFEGWSAKLYDDPAGYCTIGYGHLIALAKCDSIDTSAFPRPLNLQEGEALLEQDTMGARAAVQDLVSSDLDSNQFGALVSFTFNVGKSKFARSTLLKFVNAGDMELAAAEFSRWIRAGGKVLPGLVARRACEQQLFQRVLSLKASGKFDREACGSLGVAPDTSFLIDVDVGER